MSFRGSRRRLSPEPSGNWLSNTQERIDAQAALVAKLEPNSRAHRKAVELLFLFQDSLHVLSETDELLHKLREKKAKKILGE